jgi:ribosomal protein S16
VERGAQATDTVASLIRQVAKKGGGSEPVSL